MQASTPVPLQDSLSARRTTRAMSRISSTADAAADLGLTKRKFAREFDDVATGGALAHKAPKPLPAAAAMHPTPVHDEVLALEELLPQSAMKDKWRFAQRRWARRVSEAAARGVHPADIGEALLELESNLKPSEPRAGWVQLRLAWHADVAGAVELGSMSALEQAFRALRHALRPLAEPAAADAETDEAAWIELHRRHAPRLLAEHAPRPPSSPLPAARGAARSAATAGIGGAALEASPASTEPATRSPAAPDCYPAPDGYEPLVEQLPQQVRQLGFASAGVHAAPCAAGRCAAALRHAPPSPEAADDAMVSARRAPRAPLARARAGQRGAHARAPALALLRAPPPPRAGG